jgi:hypothetical protein
MLYSDKASHESGNGHISLTGDYTFELEQFNTNYFVFDADVANRRVAVERQGPLLRSGGFFIFHVKLGSPDIIFEGGPYEISNNNHIATRDGLDVTLSAGEWIMVYSTITNASGMDGMCIEIARS